MRASFTIPAAVVAVVWTAACSKPQENSAAAHREIQLPDQPTDESRVVSDLEAGRTIRTALDRPARRARTPQTAVQVRTSGPEQRPEVAPVPSPLLTASVVSLRETPELAGVALPDPGNSAGSSGPAEDQARGSGGGGREPMILIRGGIGTARDDCKLHGTGPGAGGILINRLAPPLRGGGSVGQAMPGLVRIR